MIENKSTIKLTVEVNSDSKSAPQTTEIVWPNLDYEQVLYVEKCILGGLVAMNDGAAEMANIAVSRTKLKS